MMTEKMWNVIKKQKSTKMPLIEYNVECVYRVQNAVEALAVLEPAEWEKYNK